MTDTISWLIDINIMNNSWLMPPTLRKKDRKRFQAARAAVANFRSHGDPSGYLDLLDWLENNVWVEKRLTNSEERLNAFVWQDLEFTEEEFALMREKYHHNQLSQKSAA